MSYKTDYDWTDLTDEPVNDCYLCSAKLEEIGDDIFGHNPEPVVKGVDNRVCSECNFTIVIPERDKQEITKEFKYLISEPEINRKLN